MSVCFEVSDWNPFNKWLNEDWIFCILFEGKREFNSFISFEHFIKNKEVVLLIIEIDLIDQGFLHRNFGHRKCEGFWKNWKNSTEEKH